MILSLNCEVVISLGILIHHIRRYIIIVIIIIIIINIIEILQHGTNVGNGIEPGNSMRNDYNMVVSFLIAIIATWEMRMIMAITKL